MSYEAWGDGDDGQDTDHLIEAGWWPSEQADEVKKHMLIRLTHTVPKTY